MRDNNNFDMQATLLLAAIESFTMGLIIVAQNGMILHKNKQAQGLLKEIPHSSSTALPEKIWHSCQRLLENQTDSQEELSSLFPTDCNIVLEDEISTSHGTIHMRAQWFDWTSKDRQPYDCFLITLEDRQQSLTVTANQEAQRYGLTSRETDVWNLKRMGHSYKEIAAKLYISENTVKKHLKNIYAKKDQSN